MRSFAKWEDRDPDPVLNVLYPNADSGRWTHAYEAAMSRCSLKAEVFNKMNPAAPTARAYAVPNPNGVTFTAYGEGPTVLHREFLTFDDYFTRR